MDKFAYLLQTPDSLDPLFLYKPPLTARLVTDQVSLVRADFSTPIGSGFKPGSTSRDRALPIAKSFFLLRMENLSENEPPEAFRKLRSLCRRLGLCVALMILFVFLVVVNSLGMPQEKGAETVWPDPIYAREYDVYDPASESDAQARFGYEIFRQTSKHLGPDRRDGKVAYAGNRLACANCHLDAGTRPFAAPLIGVAARFPQYRGREDRIGTLEDRINGCMERSMNGMALPEGSSEMGAMVAYLEWLGRFAPPDGMIGGQGFLKLEIPNRAVNLEQGERLYGTHCAVCHGSDGLGRAGEEGIGYLYPPLWGADSYNNGAGMTRVLTAAAFIKGNMPYGTSYSRPVLTDEEAYDVAGFINSRERPDKAGREADFPDRTKKPVSTPYGPYADPFSPEQHQLGPFRPIMEYYKQTYNITKSQ